MGTERSLEAVAEEVRRRAGVDAEDLLLLTEAAKRILGPDAIALEPELRGAIYLRPVEEGWQIVLNPDVDEPRFHLAFGLAQWALRTLMGCSGSDVNFEPACRYLAAAILVPERVIARAYARLGEDYPRLARLFQVSQATIVLRLAEVHGLERAVVTRTDDVVVRTDGAFPWATAPLLGIARGQLRCPGLARRRLRGGLDEGRVALVAV